MGILLDSSSKNLQPFGRERILPIVPLRSGVIFPGTEAVLTFGRPKSIMAIEAVANQDKEIVLSMQRNPNLAEPTPADLYQIGTLVKIEKVLRIEGEINCLVRGICRVRIISFTANEPFLIGAVIQVPDEVVEQSDEGTALYNHLINEVKQSFSLGKPIDFLTFMNIMSQPSPSDLANQIAAILDIKPSEKQTLLEITNVRERLEKIAEHLTHEIKILEIERKISSKTQEKFDKSAKEAFLRERIKTMEKELGEEEESKEIKEFSEKIKKAQMPKEVEEKARKELKRLSQMSSYNPEASYLRAYLDWLVELPWAVSTPNNIDIKAAEKILDEDHYGLKKIKERIVEYLAVMNLRKRAEQPTTNNPQPVSSRPSFPTILCFVGPPGVGKTSVGRSIARSLGRKFVKFSLGGIRDEAEIRGHRRTYVGALPGRIIQGIKQAGSKNPVFMLDEIDKVGTDFRGDPSAALLEALDPEQNHYFEDHYLDVPFDLSDVMFITTCNVLDTIPPALKDRLEIIHFPGYTEDEKFHIGRDFLIKKQLEAHGLSQSQVELTERALRTIIRKYTREAGVRNLERETATIFRKIAKEVVEGKREEIRVAPSSLPKFLGPTKFTAYLAEKKDEVGMATGLAWTEAGGDILFIEVALMPGKGTLTLTGHLGEVMKESCHAALSYVRARWQEFDLSEKFYQKTDIHVHVPEGAVPKDGPSAGIAITSALVSALTKIPVRKEVGMTGEITLRGRVLEIGGIKEKVIAAHRAGLKIIIMPRTNKKDLEDIPHYVLRDLRFVFVNHMDQVLKIALKEKVEEKIEEEIRPAVFPQPLLATLPS